ncbi:hypothetical protein [Acaryochloris marina]|uniref:Uncharacterized protein n=1 Tax=Acaryochloris marina (strain MBIC 11017) TaxID=329726 RepID=A8ZQU6_ACAM1|nr:hypothetical protein [Acaryochloris marina]ABW33382.1 hypothetical protein AM1_H0032 [Acaryochloris marina MBIC11017]
MISIPSLSLDQLEILRLAKRYSVEEFELAYESPVNNDLESPMGHPALIQGLIDAGLISVQVKGSFLRASEYQQESWAKYCVGIDHPTQEDWELWRRSFMARKEEGIDSLMIPGSSFKQFSNVWIREVDVQFVQPSNL